jgi:pimeloyl-ACP methyl ester carboxylesterase
LWLHQTDLRAGLGEIHQPVLLVRGDLDPLVPRDCTQTLAQALPAAGTLELPGCGHYAPLSHPIQLAELICCFLRCSPGADGCSLAADAMVPVSGT